jgi:hypothetical protein
VKRIATCSLLLAALALARPAHADRRIFAYTYPTMTLPQGSFEMEHYLDLGLRGPTVAWDGPLSPSAPKDFTHPTWLHQVAFEYGITDRLDFGFYNVFQQDPSGAFNFEVVKLRSRYRFGDPGEHWVDPAVYLELVYFGQDIEIEQKLILSKIVGKVEMAFNLTVEEELELDNKEWEYVAMPSLAIGYHFKPGLAVGLEYVGRMQIAEEEVESFVSYLGPCLSVASGPFYWTVAAEPQLGRRTSMAAVQIRSILGIVL